MLVSDLYSMKKNLYTFPVGALTTIIFFLIGFLTGKWQYAWLVFLANPIFYWLINSFGQEKQKAAKTEDDELDY